MIVFGLCAVPKPIIRAKLVVIAEVTPKLNPLRSLFVKDQLIGFVQYPPSK